MPWCRSRRPESHKCAQPCGRGRRHPVPVHVPGARVVGEEGALVLVVESSPDLCGDRPEAVDGRTPVTGLGDGVRHVVVQDLAQHLQGVDPGDAGRRRHGRSRRQTVHAGEEVVARHGVQHAVGTVGGDRDVDHRQPGTDQQQVALGQLLGPRVGDEVATDVGRRPVGARPRAGRQDHGARDHRLTAGETYDEPVAAALDAGDLVLLALEAGVAGELGRALQQRLDVAAVDVPRHEVLRLRGRIVVASYPPEEVLGVAREGAHPARRHVEQVAVVRGGVRRAAARRRGRVDQDDAVARRESRHQVGGGQRPARPRPRPRRRSSRPHHRPRVLLSRVIQETNISNKCRTTDSRLAARGCVRTASASGTRRGSSTTPQGRLRRGAGASPIHEIPRSATPGEPGSPGRRLTRRP